MADPVLRGRFAPSPTGPLHFGSLVAAVGSYLDIKSRGGQWLVRMEDLDPPREQAGAADTILYTLESYALTWDGTVVYQSTRGELYEAAIQQLQSLGKLYYCQCSRKQIEAHRLTGIEGFRYPGTCRQLDLGPAGNSLRVRAGDEDISATDRIQGEVTQNLQRDIGDFVLRRRDGLYSYQLAVVVDDADQGITEVCRGTDLLDSTPRQVYLQTLLGYPHPVYAHLPVAINAAGQKLSKQTFAEPLAANGDSNTLATAMTFLGHSPPRELTGAPPADLLAWGVQSWDLSTVPATIQIQSPV